eukprot:CAMPEP_0185037642 /NCGR_PEP_ID=MMETSP1103-20130426/32359_1 /TAXON_ID=36769 /ORGANISM="Paraphysomonas bandaiensis, Strain Caron Lab Isolate" /LENGTH=703 /DNA_ID=CAMNT_0027575719 /DNA_START=47 /DNA_END=2155 /DNA_ORIENTATION=-
MDNFEAQRKKRMEDLENKRKRLEEMRKMKKEREMEQNISSSTTSTAPTASTASTVPAKSDIDDLVNSLLTTSDSSSTNENTMNVSEVSTSQPIVSREEERKKIFSELVVSNAVQINIAPIICETYDKECQTDNDGLYGYESEESEMNSTPHRRTRSESNANAAKPAQSAQSPGGSVGSPTRVRNRTYSGESLVEPMKALTLSTDEINTILQQDAFKSFVSSSAHVVERALGLANSIDILKDYTGTDKGAAGRDDSSVVMSRLRTFRNSTVDGRPIMDIQRSPHHSELFLVAYGSRSGLDGTSKIHSSASPDMAASHSNGLLCVWSLILIDAPEFTFSSPSPVLVARFHPDDPHIITAGCYSGQILLWDTRVSTSRPAHRSSIAGKGHKHPVFSMCLSKSSAGSVTLITASTDGTLCQWDLNNLTDPISITCLTAPPISLLASNHKEKDSTDQASSIDSKPISVSCMELGPDEDSRKLIVGSEGGTLSVLSLPLKNTGHVDQVAAHFGMVTAIHVNPSTSKAFKDLIITSSVDWTVKLWNIEHINPKAQPLMEFTGSSFDYVCGVRWSPMHPGLFSAITSGGMLLLWNVCQSISEPVGSLRVQMEDKTEGTANPSSPSRGGHPSGSTSTPCPLNKTAWLDDGRKLLVGDSRGRTCIVSVRPTVTSLRAGDEERLEMALVGSHSKLTSFTIHSHQKKGGSGDEEI